MKQKLGILISFLVLLTGLFWLLVTVFPLATASHNHKKLVRQNKSIFEQCIKLPDTKNIQSNAPPAPTAGRTSARIHNNHTVLSNKEQKKKSHAGFQTLDEENSETVGWITVSGTSISEVFVQHRDNRFYLTHGFDRKTSRYGCIFLDYQNANDFSSPNNILYGHNMRDGSMFHELIQFKKKPFFEKHIHITIYTRDCTFLYKIFSVYTIDTKNETIPSNFSTEKEFLQYVEDCQKRSLFSRDINLSETDHLLTLVTCSYETSHTRTVLQGQLESRILQ